MSETPDLLVQISGETTTVSLPAKALTDGCLDSTRAQLRALLGGVSDGELRLDFACIDSLNSSALGMLVSLHRRVNDAGGHLVLYNLAPDLRDLFRLTRL